MYFIYLLVFLLIDTLTLFFIGSHYEPGTDMYGVFLVFSIIFLVAFTITSIVTIGQQLNLHTECKKYVQRIVTEKRNISLSIQKCDELKVYFEKYMGTDYPQFERDLLTSITQKPDQAIAIFQAYPKLEASLTMSKLTDQVKEMVNNIYEGKRNLEDTKENIRVLMDSPWLLVKPKINVEEL